MKRAFVLFTLSLSILLLSAVAPASADAACLPAMDIDFINLFADEPNTLHYTIELDGDDCGAPNIIGVLIWVDYISRTDVNQPWSEVDTLEFITLLPEELAGYATWEGDFIIANQLNIANLIDDEFSKFRLRVVTYDHITDTDTYTDLGWIDGPNDWQVSGQFEGRPGDLTTQQRQPNNGLVQPRSSLQSE